MDSVIQLVRCGHCGFVSGPDLGECPKCGYDGIDPPSEPIEVIPASHPLLLSEDEARLVSRWLTERPCAGNATQASQEALRDRLREYVGDTEVGGGGR
jgi:hypothetical protein